MTFRQARLLLGSIGGAQTGDFYKLSAFSATNNFDAHQELLETSVLTTPIATGVSIYKIAGVDIADPKSYGFLPPMDISYYDIIHMSVDALATFTPNQGWVFQFHCTGHPDDHLWFRQFGQPVVYPFHGQAFAFWVRQIAKPRMVS